MYVLIVCFISIILLFFVKIFCYIQLKVIIILCIIFVISFCIDVLLEFVFIKKFKYELNNIKFIEKDNKIKIYNFHNIIFEYKYFISTNTRKQ